MATITKKKVQLTVDEPALSVANEYFESMGLSFSTAVNMFIHNVQMTGTLGFTPKVKTGLQLAMDDLKNGRFKDFSSVDALFEDLSDDED